MFPGTVLVEGGCRRGWVGGWVAAPRVPPASTSGWATPQLTSLDVLSVSGGAQVFARATLTNQHSLNPPPFIHHPPVHATSHKKRVHIHYLPPRHPAHLQTALPVTNMRLLFFSPQGLRTARGVPQTPKDFAGGPKVI